MDGAPFPLLTRRLLHDGPALRVGRVVARPPCRRPTEIEAAPVHVLALPLTGVFARHGAECGDTFATPAHAVVFPAGRGYRMSLPGDVGDDVLTLQWSPAALDAAMPGALLRESHAVLGPGALLRRALLSHRLAREECDAVEAEEHALALLEASLPRGAARGRPRDGGGRQRIGRVKEAIALAPEHRWTLGELASHAALSPYHLAHLFRREAGMPVHAYVTRARLARSLDAVLEGEHGMARIALDCGFSSHSHFTARFHAAFGTTPARLRSAASRRDVREMRRIVAAARDR